MTSPRNILAHRGMSTLAPENTMPAFELLTKYGVKWLETDLGITKDEHVVVLHDDYLDRTTSGSGPLTDIMFDDLRQLDAGSWFSPEFTGVKVPTMDELIDFVNRNKVNINIELKAVIGPDANRLADSLVKQFAAALDRLNPDSRVIISSFNPIMLLKMKQLKPDLEYAVLFEDHTFYDDWTLIMQATGAKIIHPQSEHLTRGTVQQMKDYGYEVNVWTVDTIDRANELFNWGVDGIFTDIAQSFPPHHQKGAPRYGKFLTTWF